jgi:hypothetical protein
LEEKKSLQIEKKRPIILGFPLSYGPLRGAVRFNPFFVKY